MGIDSCAGQQVSYSLIKWYIFQLYNISNNTDLCNDSGHINGVSLIIDDLTR